MTDQETAIALLDAAEAAFVEDGIDAASLRSIMRSAGSNAAAVHYHYGGREKLASAVVQRILTPLQDRRLELLDQVVEEARPTAPSLAALLDALVRPDFEAQVATGQRNPAGARIIGLIYSRPPSFVKDMVEASFAPVAGRFGPQLAAALPEISPDELVWRVRWAVFGLLGALLSDNSAVITNDSIENEVARTVAVLAGALAAPPSKEKAT